MARECPRCRVPMTANAGTFAEVDVCPSCAGSFFDAGDAVATFGAHAEPSFLVAEGRARRAGTSELACPSGHGAMGRFVVTGEVPPETRVRAAPGPFRAADRAPRKAPSVEVDLCEECGAFFLDAGETAVLAELDAQPASAFVLPPGANEARVIDGVRRDGSGARAWLRERIRRLIFESRERGR